MQVIKGDVQLNFGTNADSTGRVTGAYMSMDLNSSVNVFKKLTIMQGALRENSLGLYSFGSVGRLGKVKFASLLPATPHMLRPRGNKGCIWDPVGRTAISVTEFGVVPVKYQGGFCPDTFWGECFEQLLGTGNDINDVYATEEGRAIVTAFLESIYESLSDSVWNLAWYAEHPLIAAADAADSYGMTNDEEWDHFVAQQSIGQGGWMTLVDAFKAEGRTNYNVDIPVADVNNGAFVGNVSKAGGLFKRLEASSTREMKAYMKSMTKRVSGLSQTAKPIILVTPAIFDAYIAELQADNGAIPDHLYYRLNGTFRAEMGITENIVMEGVIKWEGFWVVRFDEWDWFYDAVGIEAHIAMMVIPGVFGLATDVAELDQARGLGMIIEQDLSVKAGGEVSMAANFDIGMGITHPEFITYAALHLPKAVV